MFRHMSKWGFVVGRVPEARCLPPTSVRVIVLITIIFALIAIALAVVTLVTRQDHTVAAALTAVVATVALSEGAVHRLTQWQRPSSA